MILEHLLRGILGLFILIGLTFLMSKHRKHIDWRLVFTGIFLQLAFGFLVLNPFAFPWLDFVSNAFSWMSDRVVDFLSLADVGSQMVFGDLVKPNNSLGYIFAFRVLPTIVFFSAFSTMLYYMGILQKIAYVFAWLLSKTMRLSGAESLSAAANIFVGQTEAPLVVKPYLERMNNSELMTLMVGGFATIAGAVLAAYVGFLGGDDPVQKAKFAKHLLSASIMSAPAAIVVAKILRPLLPNEKIDTSLKVSKEKVGANILDAISRGTTDGVKLAVNVGAMLLVFTAIMAVLNWGLAGIGDITNLNDVIASSSNGMYDTLSMQFLLGKLFSPMAWVIGVAQEDLNLVGQLLGEKMILNEFFAYDSLSKLSGVQEGYTNLFSSEKSVIIATYALCGFANFASIGIQIGGIGVLAPGQRKNLSKLGLIAMLGGTIAALMTATIAGMLLG